MWFFVAVLILFGSTFEMERWAQYVLPQVSQWAWWTFFLYMCGIAASTANVSSIAERLMALFGYVLVVIYYRAMSDTYLQFLPEDASNPDLWPTVFLAVNLLGPLLLITVGLAVGAGVQRGRR